MKYAAIDIGTNAARLLIGEVIHQNGYSFVQKLSYTRVPLRLGFEVFNDGVISKEKIAQFIKTMQAFQLIAEVYNVAEIRACATSAMREANNGVEVQQLIKKKTGVNIEIIDGKEEGTIILSTFFLLAIDKQSPFIVIDVGGGSTEISIFQDGKKLAGNSFPIGTIRILQNKVSNDQWKQLKKWLLKNNDLGVKYKVFATGGNINRLHKLLNKQFMEPISTEELNTSLERLKELTIEERIHRFQLKADRADVIVPACEIYSFVIDHLKSNQLYVPKIGLSDGMIYHMHKKQLASQKK